MRTLDINYYKRDFWIEENLNYVRPHYRLEKCARLVNKIAGVGRCDLLDVGCGPAALSKLLRRNINYYGIDLALHQRAPNLIETDFLEKEIGFNDKRFDIVVAQGVFEYVGRFQAQKFSEIKRILNPEGRFIVSYLNFDHIRRRVLPIYNNIQSIEEFKRSLGRFFVIEKFFPTSHHWRHKEPGRRITQRVQMRINANIPFISPRVAVQYFFVCGLDH